VNQYGFSNEGMLRELLVHEMAQEIGAKYPDADPLAYESSMHLVRAFGTMTALTAPLLEAAGLTGARMSVLALLDRSPNKWLTIGEVAASMNVTSGNVTQVVNGLVREGFARRVGHPTDKRTTIVEMTEKGQQVYDEVRPMEQKLVSSVWAGLTDREKVLLTHLLAKLRMNHLAVYADEEVGAGKGIPKRRRPFKI
jgi:DNA-binding MarR family transcriptional regulator